MIGTSVSHYRILASIGAGGMGVVYLAEDERLHRQVALKFLPPAIAQDGLSRARLLREAQAASALDHPNVATVYDIGEWNGRLFIAMPFYDGQTLRQRVEHGPLAIGVKYSDGDEVAAAAELVAFEARDYRNEKPVGDDVFAAYRTLYEYDKPDLAARADAADDSSPDWRIERVSFAAAYGGERVPAIVYLPKEGKPLYQAVVYFPNSGPLTQRSSAQINVRAFDWVMKSGRALIYPIYKSTFERGDGLTSDFPTMTNLYREHVIAWAKDVRRSVDYLETRPDIDRNRIAFIGASWGAAMAPVFLAVEPRFKAAVIVVGGFYVQRSKPEVEAINFAPRATTPVLMLNGRFDFFLPEDTSQIPMFRLFGAPESQKRRIVYDTGHNIPRPDLIRESLDWFDKQLGAVKN